MTCHDMSYDMSRDIQETFRIIQWTFSEHSVNIQGTISEHSVNIQWTFSEHSVNIQWTFSEHSVNIHGIFLEHSVNSQVRWTLNTLTSGDHLRMVLKPVHKKHSGNNQWTFREHSVNIKSTFSHHLASFREHLASFRWGAHFVRRRASQDGAETGPQKTFREQSVNIQGTFGGHSVNIQSTFSQHLASFREHLASFRRGAHFDMRRPRGMVLNSVNSCRSQHSVNIWHHSGNIWHHSGEGRTLTCGDHEGWCWTRSTAAGTRNIPFAFRTWSSHIPGTSCGDRASSHDSPDPRSFQFPHAVSQDPHTKRDLRLIS
jgi:hypothetical protein